MKLESIETSGYRSIGNPTKLDFGFHLKHFIHKGGIYDKD